MDADTPTLVVSLRPVQVAPWSQCRVLVRTIPPDAGPHVAHDFVPDAPDAPDGGVVEVTIRLDLEGKE